MIGSQSHCKGEKSSVELILLPEPDEEKCQGSFTFLLLGLVRVRVRVRQVETSLTGEVGAVKLGLSASLENHN